MSIKPKYKEMKTKIIYTIVFLMIAKLAYSQEEQYSADKFVAKCPNEIFIGAILEANSINQDTYKFLKNINESYKHGVHHSYKVTNNHSFL